MDLESRTHRKRSAGRWRKQIGDLTFQAGLTAGKMITFKKSSIIKFFKSHVQHLL